MAGKVHYFRTLFSYSSSSPVYHKIDLMYTFLQTIIHLSFINQLEVRGTSNMNGR